MTSASIFINVTYLLHGNPNDLRHLLSYERRQHVVFVDANLPSIKATISDGGILLYESVMQHSKSTYAASVFPSRRVYYSTNTSLHPSRMLVGNWWLRYSECIHHYRPRPSPAKEWNRASQKRGIQGRVCQFPHDRMEEGPLWTSNLQHNDLHLTMVEKCMMMMQNNNEHDRVITEPVNLKVDTKKLTRSSPFMQNKHLRETY